jgi:CheY-like chemotaxis protein
MPDELANTSFAWPPEAFESQATAGGEALSQADAAAAEGGQLAAPAYVTMPSAGDATPEKAAEGAASPGQEILVVDDMANVAKRFRDLVPATVSVDACTTSDEALRLARLKTYRIIVMDMQMPNTDTGMLLRQISLFQTTAAFVAMGLKTSANLLEDARTLGFDGVLNKPFEPAKVGDLIDRYFEAKEKITVEENIVTIGVPPGGTDRLAAFYYRVCNDMPRRLEGVAEACYDNVIINAGELRGTRKNVVEVLVKLKEAAANLGLELSLVVSSEVVGFSKEFVETRNLRMFGSLEEAHAAIEQAGVGG